MSHAGHAPVPRTRSSHQFSAGTVANFGFKSGTRIIELLVSFRFRSSLRDRGKRRRTSESGHWSFDRRATTRRRRIAAPECHVMNPESHRLVESVVDAFRRGEIVVVTDDDDRENEGDLFVAASMCTPEKMAFIIRHTSGIVCAPLAAEEAKRLHLDPMVAANDAPLGTAFTVSVDVRHGLTTGISAEERTNTVRALANGNSGASDFVRPGHVFPLVGKEGGVLMRSGHTEACIDLCQLAGLPPVGVLAELMNDDGTVTRGAAVSAFAEKHRLKRITIADLIAYRQARDKLVKRIGEFPVNSEIGTLQGYAYVTPFDAIH